MLATYAAFLNTIPNSSTDVRRTIAGGYTHTTASGTTVRSGVIRASDNALQVAAAGSLFISVAPGQAIVDGQFIVTHDASVNVTVDAGGASTRWDAIVLRVEDVSLGDTANQSRVFVVKGTTTAIPTLPARSILLGTVVVGAGVTSVNSSNVVDRRTYTASSGGIVPIPGALADQALATGIPTGTMIWDSAADRYLTKKASSVARAAPEGHIYKSAAIKGPALSDMNALRIVTNHEILSPNSTGHITVTVPFTQTLAFASCHSLSPDSNAGHISPDYAFTWNTPGVINFKIWRRDNVALPYNYDSVRVCWMAIGA